MDDEGQKRKDRREEKRRQKEEMMEKERRLRKGGREESRVVEKVAARERKGKGVDVVVFEDWRKAATQILVESV